MVGSEPVPFFDGVLGDGRTRANYVPETASRCNGVVPHIGTSGCRPKLADRWPGTIP